MSESRYQEAAAQHRVKNLLLQGSRTTETTMHSSRAPPSLAAGPPSDRPEFGPGMMGTPSAGPDLGADGSAFEYEVKRQRLLQGGSAAASGMLNPFYQSQPSSQLPFPSSSTPASLQSNAASAYSLYYASPTPSAQHPMAPVAATGMYSSLAQHVPTAAVPSNAIHPSLSPIYASNPGSGYSNLNGTGPNPNQMNSGAISLGSSNTNDIFMNNSGRSLNPISSTSYASSTHMQPFIGAGATVPLSSGISPYRAGSPLGIPGQMNHHASGSPPPQPLPVMPFEQSPHHSHSSPPSAFKGPGFLPFPTYSRPFPVVRIRGLPFNCSESDVYEFFGGLDVVDVLLTHRHGRFSGEAYCVFGLPMQVELALHRNRKSMGQRYIEVFRSKKHEYYLAVAAEVSEQEKVATGELAPNLPPPKSMIDKEQLEHTGVLKLRGLPFSASKRDLIEFFKDFNLKDENIRFVIHSDGRASGEAFVEFDGPTQSKHAMARDKMMLGSRYIELFPSSSKEAAKATGQHKK